MGAYALNDRLKLTIFFDDKPYYLTSDNTLTYLHMCFSTKYAVPSCSFALTDVTGMMDEMSIGDGTVVKIIIDTDQFEITREFRVFDWQNPKAQKTWVFDCYWDMPQYFLETVDRPITGTSSAVVTEIARKTGWPDELLDIDYTSDHQTWYPGNKTYATFVKQITASAYKNDESFMQSVIDSDNRFRFQDARKPKKLIIVGQGYLSDQAVQCMDFDAKIIGSTFNNPVNKYRSLMQPQSLDNTQNKVIDSLTFRQHDKRLLVNNKMQEIIKKGNASFGPICAGNVHANAQKAQYINQRFNSLQSVQATFMFDHVTDIEPLDGIVYTSPQVGDQYSGQYTVSEKVIWIQNTTYLEKIIGLREGLDK